MKKILFVITMFLITNVMFAADFNVADIKFVGININDTKIKIKGDELNQKFCVIYSSILPDGAIYSLSDKVTGAEAVAQVGYSRLDETPEKIFMNEILYDYFDEKYEDENKEIILQIKFIGWNKPKEESILLNIDNMIVAPEQSLSEMMKDEDDKYYIQLGSYHFYQNSYPRIIELLPALEVKPKFYMMKKVIDRDGKQIEVYRVLAGPYNFDDAKSISKSVNSKYDASVFLQSKTKLMTEDKNEVIYESKK